MLSNYRSFSCAKQCVQWPSDLGKVFSVQQVVQQIPSADGNLCSSLPVKKDHPSIDCDVFQNLQLLWLLHNSGFLGCGNPQFPLDHTLPSRNPCRPCHCIPLHPHIEFLFYALCLMLKSLEMAETNPWKTSGFVLGTKPLANLQLGTPQCDYLPKYQAYRLFSGKIIKHTLL